MRIEPELLDLEFPTVEENLGCDDAALDLVGVGGGPAFLRFWECPRPAVLMGRAGRIAEDVNIDECRRDDVPIIRRCSGGGTVLLATGCLAYSLVFPIPTRDFAIEATTHDVLRRVVDALRPLVPSIKDDGASDLVVSGRKVSGNAQRWTRNAVLHHGTLLYDFPIAIAERYLKLPERQPAYRRGRTHSDFLANLPVDGVQLRRALIDYFRAKPATTYPSPDEVRTHALRYRNEEWNFAR